MSMRAMFALLSSILVLLAVGGEAQEIRTGRFSPWQGWGADHYAEGYGDFNGDGKADLIFRHAGGNMWVNLSTGAGFAGWGDWGAGHYASGWADFNGDGRADLIFKHANGNMWVNLSSGTGFVGWGDWGAGHYASGNYHDFNGDGKADLIFKHANGNMWVNLSTGAGFAGWGDWGADHYAEGYGDFNGDGRTDLIFKHANGNMWVNLSTGAGFAGWGDWGAGHYAQLGAWVPWSCMNQTPECADFNGDGKADLIFKHADGQTWVNPSSGSGFTGWDSWGGEHYANAFADFTGDGMSDLIFKHADGSMWICPAELRPRVKFTFVPEIPSADAMQGVVSNVDFAQFKVVAFILVPGLGWISKPDVIIQQDGTWECPLPGRHAYATRVFAFLTRQSYNSPYLEGVSSLPVELYDNCVAFDDVTRSSSIQGPPGYSLAWSDEFNGTTLDASVWSHEIGGHGWGNNELQYYTDRTTGPNANSYLENGNLVIAARHEPYGGRSYTSARLTTRDKLAVRYGRIEARIKAPSNVHGVWDQGSWPAFWMMGSRSPEWAFCGEIDIFEMSGKYPQQLVSAVVWENFLPPQRSSSVPRHSSLYALQNPAHTEYRVYSITWDDRMIYWHVDGEQRLAFDHYGLKNRGLPVECEQTFMHPFYMILNQAVGGNWTYSGVPNPADYPQFMYVDWVRIWIK